MKIILYMAITANGMISKEDGETPWLETEWKSYNSTVKKFGNLIIGRKTYDLMKGDEFSGLGDPTIVVLTTGKNLKPAKNIIFVNTIQQALDVLKKKGFKTALVGGGGKLNSAFMKDGLVDEIYLDIEPLIFGKGIKLFADAKFEASLELIGIKKLSKNEIQLHYKVKK